MVRKFANCSDNFFKQFAHGDSSEAALCLSEKSQGGVHDFASSIVEDAATPCAADQVNVFGVKVGLDFSAARIARKEGVHFLIRSTNADKVSIFPMYLSSHTSSIS
jgi:hypothetical protein